MAFKFQPEQQDCEAVDGVSPLARLPLYIVSLSACDREEDFDPGMTTQVAQEHVSTFWNGNSLSPVEIACLTSFVQRGIAVRFFSYDPVALPAGVRWVDAGTVLPRDRLFHFDGSPSAFSNVFRYTLLHEEGGWWVDTDVVFSGSSLPALSHYWAWQDRSKINGAVLRFPKGDALCAGLLAESLSRASSLTEWGEIGPDLLTRFIRGGPFEAVTQEMETTYPVHWLQSHYFWFPELAPLVHARARRATFLHLWNSLFDRMGLDIGRTVPRGSYLDELTRPLFHDYGVELDDAARAAAAASVRRYLGKDWVQPILDRTLPEGEQLLLPDAAGPRHPSQKETPPGEA